MGDDRMSPGAVAQAEPTHFSTTFGKAGYSAPTACGRTEQPKPASNVWANVTCAACLERAPDDEKARRVGVALRAGQEPDFSWEPGADRTARRPPSGDV